MPFTVCTIAYFLDVSSLLLIVTCFFSRLFVVVAVEPGQLSLSHLHLSHRASVVLFESD